MFIFDLKTKDVICNHQKDALTFESHFPDNLYEECIIGAYDATVTDNIVVALCADSSSKDLEENDNSLPRIRFYSWEGEYLGGVILDKKVSSIAFDETNDLLFGLYGKTEDIYVFNVKGIYRD